MGAKLSTSGHSVVGSGGHASQPIEAAESALARHSTPPVDMSRADTYSDHGFPGSEASDDGVHQSVLPRDLANLSRNGQPFSNFMGFSFFRSNSMGSQTGVNDGSRPSSYSPMTTATIANGDPVEYRTQPASEVGSLGSSGGSGASGMSAPASGHGISPFTLRRIMFSAQSLPTNIWTIAEVKCPVCDVSIPHDDIERHLIMCLTRPRLRYNEETLVENKGECVICLEDMDEGHVIARLPCLCIYHKDCIKAWFRHKDACPTHPDS